MSADQDMPAVTEVEGLNIENILCIAAKVLASSTAENNEVLVKHFDGENNLPTAPLSVSEELNLEDKVLNNQSTKEFLSFCLKDNFVHNTPDQEASSESANKQNEENDSTFISEVNKNSDIVKVNKQKEENGSKFIPENGIVSVSSLKQISMAEKDECSDGEITNSGSVSDVEVEKIQYNKPGFKKRICHFFQRGKCFYGNSCHFYHSELGLYGMTDNNRSPIVFYRTDFSYAVTPRPTDLQCAWKKALDDRIKNKKKRNYDNDSIEYAWDMALAKAQNNFYNKRRRTDISVEEMSPQIRNLEITNDEKYNTSNSQLPDDSTGRITYISDYRQNSVSSISHKPQKRSSGDGSRNNKESDRQSVKSLSPQVKCKDSSILKSTGRKRRRSKSVSRSCSASASYSVSSSFSFSASSSDSSYIPSDRKTRSSKSSMRRLSRKKSRSWLRSSTSSIVSDREKVFHTKDKFHKKGTSESRFKRCKKSGFTSDRFASKPREKNYNSQIPKKVRSHLVTRSMSRSPTRSSVISLSDSSSCSSVKHTIYRGGLSKKDLRRKLLFGSFERKTISPKKHSFRKCHIEPSLIKQSPERIKSLPTFKSVKAYNSNAIQDSTGNIRSDPNRSNRNIIIKADSCKRKYSRTERFPRNILTGPNAEAVRRRINLKPREQYLKKQSSQGSLLAFKRVEASKSNFDQSSTKNIRSDSKTMIIKADSRKRDYFPNVKLLKKIPSNKNPTCRSFNEIIKTYLNLKPKTLPVGSPNIISAGDRRCAVLKKGSGKLTLVPSKRNSSGSDILVCEKRDLNCKSRESPVVSTKISSSGTSLLKDLEKYSNIKPKKLSRNSPNSSSTDNSLQKGFKKDLDIKTKQRFSISSKVSSTDQGLDEVQTKNLQLNPERALNSSDSKLCEKVVLKAGSATAVPEECEVKTTACVRTETERKEASGAVDWLLSYSNRPQRSNHTLNEKSEESRLVKITKVAQKQIETRNSLFEEESTSSLVLEKSKSQNAVQLFGKSSDSLDKRAAEIHLLELRRKCLVHELDVVDEALSRLKHER